jgi:hypothetical protein
LKDEVKDVNEVKEVEVKDRKLAHGCGLDIEVH